MKTLYININNEQIQSSEELEVLKYDLDNDFFFYIGEKIAKGCNVDNRIHLITEFNTTDNQKDYQQITSQWNEVKGILFSEECACEFKVSLPDKYIHWLKFHPQYVEMYDKNFSHGESNVISIDLEELYEESIEDMQREILRKLKRDDLHKEIDEIVFNDDGVSRNSPNVCIITEKYKNIKFKSCKKYKLREFCTFDDDVLKNKEQNDGTLDIAPEISIEKRIEIALQYIHGIGPAKAKQICDALKLKDGLRAKDLTDADVIKISNYIEENFKVEGDVRREVTMNIKRLQDLKAYRGIRHRNRLPVRGQRTQTNARTRKGKRVVVAGSATKGK